MLKPYYETELGKLYHGDCLEIMPQLPKVDLVLTDPPYGIDHNTHGQRFRGIQPISGDKTTFFYSWLNLLGLPMVVFYSPYMPPPVRWSTILVWSKGRHVGIGGDRETCWKRDFELIGAKRLPKLNGKRDGGVVHVNALVKKPSGHFCEKPIGIMLYLLNKIPADITVDPFFGSGTTGVACERLGRKWIGIELEEKYCEIAAERLRLETQQMKLFG